ncbi:MAG: nicotinamide-nucleotide amidohydrolase family protein [Chitinivibrionales bacterium]|nr:nicotinamide-nucleotide amidohydrolase family protein [Chitinivibrionales bacterium]
MKRLPEIPGHLPDRLVSKSMFLSVAESCTGGMIGQTLTSRPGASAWFAGGIIAYSNSVKQTLCNVSEGLLEKHGAVSPETAQAMALGVRRTIPSGCSLAVTGIAGPGGGTVQKPVGLVYIAVSVADMFDTSEHLFGGDRESIRSQTVIFALNKLHRMLRE